MGGGLPNMITGPYPIATAADKLAPSITRDVTLNSTTLNGSANASNSFDLTVLDSKEFYQALLSPVDLPTLNFFIRQGYPHELLYWLFAEAVRETVGEHTTEYRNRPDETCEYTATNARCFNKLVDVAVANGLTVETKSIALTSAGKTSTEVYGRFCFDPVLGDRVKKDYSEEEFPRNLRVADSYQPRCGGPWVLDARSSAKTGGLNDVLKFQVADSQYGLIRYEVITRSTFGIYQFLGRILDENATDRVRLHRRSHAEDTRLLTVVRDVGGESCFVDLSYEGSYYCVPANGGDHTKQIFSILAQLLALKTQTGDLAITPSVRIAP
jgi:hypothetical protein